MSVENDLSVRCSNIFYYEHVTSMLKLQIHGQLIINQLIIKLYISVFFAIQNQKQKNIYILVSIFGEILLYFHY